MKSIRVSVSQGEMAGDTESILKGQSTTFSLQPLNLGNVKGKAEWTRDARGESGVSGSGEKTEVTATRTHVLNHSPTSGAISQAEHSSQNGISRRRSNSPAHKNYSAPPCGVFA